MVPTLVLIFMYFLYKGMYFLKAFLVNAEV